MDNLALVMREVREIARVPKDNHVRFVRLLEQCIRSADDESRVRRGQSASAGAIKADFFEPVVRAAKELRIALERIQGDHLAAGEAPRSAAAQLFFNYAMQRQFRFRDATHPIEALLQTLALDTVIEASDHASQQAGRWLSKPGRKKGTGKPAFDMFVMRLLAAAETNGGKLTIYKTAYHDDQWAGSLLQSIQRLRPFLPETNFLPRTRLGSSLDSILRRWRSESGSSSHKKPAKSPAKKH